VSTGWDNPLKLFSFLHSPERFACCGGFRSKCEMAETPSEAPPSSCALGADGQTVSLPRAASESGQRSWDALCSSVDHLNNMPRRKKTKEPSVVTARTAWKTMNKARANNVPITRCSFLDMMPTWFFSSKIQRQLP